MLFRSEPVDWNRNLLPAAVWIGWWVGLAVVGALVGNLWPLIDPWQTVAAWSFARRPATRRLPEGLDAWPAVVLFFAFAWCELAWPDNAAPRKLAIVISAYSAAAWTVMAIFGAAAWRRHFDPFSRFFDLLGRFAPLAVGCDSAGRWSVTLRGYGAGLAHGARPSNAETAFVIVVLATVSFDGIAETPFWDAAVGHAIGRLYDAGVVGAVGYAASGAAIKTAGLALAPLIFGAVYLAVCAATARLGREPADAVARRHALDRKSTRLNSSH